jgi:DNA topoisomerase III
MALVTAYDKMNIELSLSKPGLRSLMETNMKRICDGQMSKEEMVRAAVAIYQQAFEAAEAQSKVLIDSMAEYMDSAPLDVDEEQDNGAQIIRKCMKCNSPMTLRKLPSEKYMIGNYILT